MVQFHVDLGISQVPENGYSQALERTAQQPSPKNFQTRIEFAIQPPQDGFHCHDDLLARLRT